MNVKVKVLCRSIEYLGKRPWFFRIKISSPGEQKTIHMDRENTEAVLKQLREGESQTEDIRLLIAAMEQALGSGKAQKP